MQQPNSVNLVFEQSSGIQGFLTGVEEVVAFTSYLALISPSTLLSAQYWFLSACFLELWFSTVLYLKYVFCVGAIET